MPPGGRPELPRTQTRLGPALLAFAIALLTLAVTRLARAWNDVHVAGDEVHVTLDPSGSARIEHRIRLHVSGSPLSSWDLHGVDRDAVPEPDGYVVPVKDAAAGSLANATPITAELLPLQKPREGQPPPVSVLRVRFEHPRGLPHGAYVLLLRYRTELAARGFAVPDGATAKVRWDGPVFEDGFDNARVTFDLPSAPTEPRNEEATPPAGEPDDGPTNPPMFLSTVRRGPARDEIELLRPYAAKSEAITWAIRADARVLRRPAADPATGKAPPAPPIFDLFGLARPSLILGAAAAIFALYSALVALKSREVARLARAAGAEPSPLLPLPLAIRAAAAGLCLTAGVALELLLDTGTAGAALVAAAVVFAAHGSPRWKRLGRGPGRWLPITEAEAFREPPRPTGALLDVSTRAGKALLLLALGALGGGVALAWELSPYHAWLLGFDAVAVLAIFGTGRIRELPPDPALAPAPLLRGIAERLRKKAGEHLRLVPRIRVPNASPDADELRLGVAPRRPLDGLIAIEIGVVYASGVGGAIALPEILVRVRAGSECELAIEPLARRARSMRGRRPDERVLAFTPRLPTAGMTAAIVVALAAKASRREEAAPANAGGAAAANVARKRAA